MSVTRKLRIALVTGAVGAVVVGSGGVASAAPAAPAAASDCGFSFAAQTFRNCQNYAHLIGANYLGGPTPGGVPSNSIGNYCIRAQHTANIGNPARGVVTTVFNHPESRCMPGPGNTPPLDK